MATGNDSIQHWWQSLMLGQGGRKGLSGHPWTLWPSIGICKIPLSHLCLSLSFLLDGARMVLLVVLTDGYLESQSSMGWNGSWATAWTHQCFLTKKIMMIMKSGMTRLDFPGCTVPFWPRKSMTKGCFCQPISGLWSVQCILPMCWVTNEWLMC